MRTSPIALKRALPPALADENNELSGEMRELLGEMSQWRRALEERIASCEAKIAQQFKRDERCARLAKVPGVGPLDVTALVAAVGNAQEFKNGRELSAFLGWFRASIPRAASECCSGLPNAAIVICARCAGENCAVLTRIWTLTTINTPARIEISRRRFST